MSNFYAVTNLHFQSHVGRAHFASTHEAFVTPNAGTFSITSPIYESKSECLDETKGYMFALRDILSESFPDIRIELEHLRNAHFYPNDPSAKPPSEYDASALMCFRLIETVQQRRSVIMAASIFAKTKE